MSLFKKYLCFFLIQCVFFLLLCLVKEYINILDDTVKLLILSRFLSPILNPLLCITVCITVNSLVTLPCNVVFCNAAQSA